MVMRRAAFLMEHIILLEINTEYHCGATSLSYHQIHLLSLRLSKNFATHLTKGFTYFLSGSKNVPLVRFRAHSALLSLTALYILTLPSLLLLLAASM